MIPESAEVPISPAHPIVERVAVEHRGGEPYFDALDSALTTPEVFEAVARMAPDDAYFVVSGKWGYAFLKWAKEHPGFRTRVATVLPGGLRHGIEGLGNGGVMSRLRWFPKSTRFAFLDDSMYLGRTTRAVRDWIIESGHEFVGAFVAYDGSPVRSLYRYHA